MGHPPPPPQSPWQPQPPPPHQPQWPPHGAGPPPYGQPPPGQYYGPPAPPHPGWHGPYRPQPARSGGGKTVGIVLGILGALIFLGGGGGLVAYFAFLRADDPEQVVENYFSAATRGDCDTMIDLVTESTWRQGGASSRAEAVADCDEAMREAGGGLGMLVLLQGTRLVSESGDHAVVAATVSVLPPPCPIGESPCDRDRVVETVDYPLRKQGRQWRIDGTETGGFGAGGFDFGDGDDFGEGGFDDGPPGIDAPPDPDDPGGGLEIPPDD